MGYGVSAMTSVPVSGASAVAAYLPFARADSLRPRGLPVLLLPGGDSVQISDEARRLARDAMPDIHLFGEVRYDPPHTDDPDFPWEVAHRQWVDLMKKVFGEGKDGSDAASPSSG